MLPTELATLVRTRLALHGVAEAVLAGPQYRRSKDIRLRVTPGGFGTVTEPELRVDGGLLVSGTHRIPITGHTYAELAAAVGIQASVLQHEVYPQGPDVRLDDAIRLDPGAASHLARCFAQGDRALRRLLPDVEPVLWPEHFDVGCTIDEINYGVSPGDGYLAEPYAYVGPWHTPRGSFWNAPFGAARALRELPTVGATVAFFREGQRRAGHGREERPSNKGAEPGPESGTTGSTEGARSGGVT